MTVPVEYFDHIDHPIMPSAPLSIDAMLDLVSTLRSTLISWGFGNVQIAIYASRWTNNSIIIEIDYDMNGDRRAQQFDVSAAEIENGGTEAACKALVQEYAKVARRGVVAV